MRSFQISVLAAGLLLAAFAPQAQIPVNPQAGSQGGENRLTGAGSSFVYPLMSKWSSVYNQATKVQVNYQSIGSGGGIKQFTAGTVDFGATDAPMTDDEMKAAKGAVLHIPVTMGAVAITYNVPGTSGTLNMSGPTIAKLFMGDIKMWNDPELAKDNPNVKLPDTAVVVVHRSDGSGTTFILADYLSKVSPEWKQRLGTGKSLTWPVGIGGKGNEGVSAAVTRTPGAIGYVELLYAEQAKMARAAVLNKAGKFVAPSAEAVTAAAAELKEIPEDLRASITDAPGETAFPISGIVWVLARPQGQDKTNAAAVRTFVEWVLGDEGQALASPMNYSKLPPALLEKARAKAAQIK